jgi:transposase
MMVSLAYGELVKLSPVVAHKKIIDCYFHQAGRKVARVARLLGISRHTVLKWLRRFFQEGEAGLENHSSRPQTSPNKTPEATEQLVLEIFQKTNYGFRRIAKILKRKHGIKISYATVGNILKRHNCYKPRIKITIRRTGRRYYNPLDFKPFEFIQMDIKDVVDGDTLPAEVYAHF